MTDQNQFQSNPPAAPQTPTAAAAPRTGETNTSPPGPDPAPKQDQTLPTFEKMFLEVIGLHRRSFDMTDERFMIALLGFLQSWVQLPGVRARAAADLALARQAASADLKRDDKTLSDGEAVDAVVSSIMAVRII